MKSGFLSALNRGVVVFDGAMGTSIHSCADCRPEDYLGRENCTDILVKSRPDLIQRIHEGFLAGDDARNKNQLVTFAGDGITVRRDIGELQRQALCCSYILHRHKGYYVSYAIAKSTLRDVGIRPSAVT